jgi:hypothetical protein
MRMPGSNFDRYPGEGGFQSENKEINPKIGFGLFS